MRHIKLQNHTAFLITVLVTTFLTSCVGAEEVSANNPTPSVSFEVCGADSCKNREVTPLYRRAFFVCGFEMAYAEPLPTIGPLAISVNTHAGRMIENRLQVFLAEGDPFRGASLRLDCLDPSLEEISLVEIFETGPNGEIGSRFPNDRLEALELQSTERPWRGCILDKYQKPFSDDLAPQVFVVARHTGFDPSDGIRCSAAAHLTLAGIDISDGVENHIELRGPLKNRFRFVTINDRN